MNAISSRNARTEKIKEALKEVSDKTNGNASLKRAVAVISLNLGINRSKTTEYIELLRDAGFIEIKGIKNEEMFKWVG